MLKHQQQYLLTDVTKFTDASTNCRSEVELRYYFWQIFAMVKASAEMAVLRVDLTAMAWCILAGMSPEGLCDCYVNVSLTPPTLEKQLDVSMGNFLVLKLRWCLKPDNYGKSMKTA